MIVILPCFHRRGNETKARVATRGFIEDPCGARGGSGKALFWSGQKGESSRAGAYSASRLHLFLSSAKSKTLALLNAYCT